MSHEHSFADCAMDAIIRRECAPLDDRDAPFNLAVSIMNAKIECTRAREITSNYGT